jgi:hypothetical protein
MRLKVKVATTFLKGIFHKTLPVYWHIPQYGRNLLWKSWFKGYLLPKFDIFWENRVRDFIPFFKILIQYSTEIKAQKRAQCIWCSIIFWKKTTLRAAKQSKTKHHVCWGPSAHMHVLSLFPPLPLLLFSLSLSVTCYRRQTRTKQGNHA